mgnify:CR=1 FL=1
MGIVGTRGLNNRQNKMNKDILKTLFPEQYERIEKGECPSCEKEIDLETEFEDNDLGMREFLISGLCEKCQGNIFDEE